MSTYQADLPQVKAAVTFYAGFYQGAHGVMRHIGRDKVVLDPSTFGTAAIVLNQILKGEPVEVDGDGEFVTEGFPGFTYQAVAVANTILQSAGYDPVEISKAAVGFANGEGLFNRRQVVNMADMVNQCLAVGKLMTEHLDNGQFGLPIQEITFRTLEADEAEDALVEHRLGERWDQFMDIISDGAEMTTTA